MAHHVLMGGKLHLYKRENSRFWQCSAYLAGKNRRVSTKMESLSQATDFAEDWFFELKVKVRSGEIKEGKTFRVAAEQFLREYPVITQGQRHPQHTSTLERKIRLYLLPYFGDKVLPEITPGMVQEYRVHRAQQLIKRRVRKADAVGQEDFVMQPPSRSTMHKEIVTLRQVLKTAHRHGWLPFVPDLSPPYKTSGKVTHRAWFSPKEYRQLYMATRQRAQEPLKRRWKWDCEQLHD